MRFYTTQHRFYCGIDLHARTMHVCVLDAAGTVVLDHHGFIETGQAAANRIAGADGPTTVRRPVFLETSVPGVFAAGDVRSGSVKRVASAVGEGAMSIRQIHEYFGT